MSKFNTNNTIKTENKSGRSAYSMTAKNKLVTQVLTSSLTKRSFTVTIAQICKQQLNR